MLTGHVGAGECVRRAQAYGGHPVSYESHRLPPEQLVELLEQAGLVVTARVLQAPEGTGAPQIATLLCRGPR